MDAKEASVIAGAFEAQLAIRLAGIERALHRVASSIDALRGVVDTTAPQEVAVHATWAATDDHEQHFQAYKDWLEAHPEIRGSVPFSGEVHRIGRDTAPRWIPAHERLPAKGQAGILVAHPELGVRFTKLLRDERDGRDGALGLWSWPSDRSGFRSVSTLGTFWRADVAPPPGFRPE